MPLFDIAFMRVDRDEDPTVVEGYSRTVDWPVLPREAEGLDISAELDPVTVESVGYDFDGHPTVFVGRVVLDDLQAAQLRKLGWRLRPLPFSRR
jgi:DNA polymerase elongation subunit (family B)